MSIWFDKTISIERIKDLGKDSMAGFLGMQWTEIGEDYLRLTMPVNERTTQVYGILHGGASCTLAETVGSVASALVIDQDKFFCVGLEINANHLRSVRQGFVIGTATPLHLGRTTHVWDIKIHDEMQKLVCISRHTVAIIPNNGIMPKM